MLPAIERLLDLIVGKKVAPHLFALDIGSGSIKLLELDLSGSKPKLVNLGVAPTPSDAITNNMIVKSEAVAEAVKKLIQAQGLEAKQVIFGLPGPSAFSKKIMLPKQSPEELAQNIEFEAGNYIPHQIEDVRLDYQVLREVGSQIEVLLVAVKNDIVSTFLNTISAAGLEPLIADVDFYALENAFELNYPEELSRTLAIVDLGARYSNIHILQDGRSLFTGDISSGGRVVTDKISDALGVSRAEAEQIKLQLQDNSDSVKNALKVGLDQLVGELHRQLGFFWSAAATDKPLEVIYLCGGSALLPGLKEALTAKTGIRVELFDPFRNIQRGDNIDEAYLREMAPSMTVSVGLALRHLGDKPQILKSEEPAA